MIVNGKPDTSKKYDFVIVGSGLFGSIVYYELTKKGYSCIVLEARDHIGGNIYTRNVDGIIVHEYGAHIFHTNEKWLWDYVNNLTPFENFINSPIANYNGKLISLPFNMNTFYQMWGCQTPEQAKRIIKKQIAEYGLGDMEPTNLEEKAISLVGTDIYKILIKDYTEKQWGMECKDLPPNIIRRLPVRYTYNNNYFNDNYQGIPVKGYTALIKALLRDAIDNNLVYINCNFLDNKEAYESMATRRVIYTGRIDSYYDYELGELEYRGLKFVHQTYMIDNYQGNAVMNYTGHDYPYTRSIEHKHFLREDGNPNKTVVSYEFSMAGTSTENPLLDSYYPINNERNNVLYDKYRNIPNDKVIFGGRLGEYKYYDMTDTIKSALELVKPLPRKENYETTDKISS